MQTAATVKEVIARVFCFLASRKPSGMKHNSKFIIGAKRKPVPMFHAKRLMLRMLKHPVLHQISTSGSQEKTHIFYFKPFSGLVLMIVVLLFIFCHGPWV